MSRQIVYEKAVDQVGPSHAAGRIGGPGGTVAVPALSTLFRPQEDKHQFTIDQGQEYAGSSVVTVSGNGTALISAQPQKGATGPQSLTVRWYCKPGAHIRYRVRAYEDTIGTPPAIEEVMLLNSGSLERITSLMNSRRPLNIIISGPDATKIDNTGMVAGITGVDDVAAIVAIAVIGGVAAITVACLTLIAIKAVEKNYDVDAAFDAGNLPTKMPSLTFKLTPK